MSTNGSVQTDSSVEQVVVDLLRMALSEEQHKAIAQKAGKLKVDFIKDAAFPGVDDVVVAYYIVKARKEADDAIFAEQKQFLFYDIQRWYMSFVSESETVVTQAHGVFDKVVETCKSDAGRLKTLAQMLRQELLKGRTSIEEEKLPAFVKAIGYLGISPESLK